jgi:hypothetical protein
MSCDGFFLCAAIALLLTALLAIAGYILQNKNAADANKVQHEVIQQAAEREKVEAKAGRQLERVHMHNAEFILPCVSLVAHFRHAYERAVLDCGLEAYLATYVLEWLSPPTQPHVSVFNTDNPAMAKAGAANPFRFTLPPEDLARLAADPVKRARWVESVTHGMLPPLRELVPILQTEVRFLSMQCGDHHGMHAHGANLQTVAYMSTRHHVVAHMGVHHR